MGEVKQKVKPGTFEIIESRDDEPGRKAREERLRKAVAVAKAAGISVAEAEARVAAEEGKMRVPDPAAPSFTKRAERLRTAVARARRNGTSIPQAETELEKGAA